MMICLLLLDQAKSNRQIIIYLHKLNIKNNYDKDISYL